MGFLQMVTMRHNFSWTTTFLGLFLLFTTRECRGEIVKIEANDLDEFRQGMLGTHNRLRYTHGAFDLQLNSTLDKLAQQMAEESADDEEFPELEAGESVFMACTTFNREINSREVVEAWYDEVCSKRFSFDQPDNKEARGFTQIVWKDSKQLGVGKAIRKDNALNVICTYVVALYYPPGNKEDKFEDNVGEGLFNREQYCTAMKAAEEMAPKKLDSQ